MASLLTWLLATREDAPLVRVHYLSFLCSKDTLCVFSRGSPSSLTGKALPYPYSRGPVGAPGHCRDLDA